MKKALFGIIAIVMFVFVGNAQKASVLDIKNKEIAFIVNQKSDNTFSDYYLFQYNTSDFSFLKNYKSLTIESVDEYSIILNCDNLKKVKFSINGNGDFKGYGMYHRKSNFYNKKTQKPLTYMRQFSTKH